MKIKYYSVRYRKQDNTKDAITVKACSKQQAVEEAIKKLRACFGTDYQFKICPSYTSRVYAGSEYTSRCGKVTVNDLIWFVQGHAHTFPKGLDTVVLTGDFDGRHTHKKHDLMPDSVHNDGETAVVLCY